MYSTAGTSDERQTFRQTSWQPHQKNCGCGNPLPRLTSPDGAEEIALGTLCHPCRHGLLPGETFRSPAVGGFA